MHMTPFLLVLQPLPETVALVEDIVVEYVTDLVRYSCICTVICVLCLAC
jgi:hypothetical protein